MATIQKTEGYTVVYTTIEEELSHVLPELQEPTLKRIFELNGCFCINLTQEHIVEGNKNLKEGMTLGLEAGLHIMIVSDFVATMSEDERKAIVLHEVGHITHEHLYKISEGAVQVVNNIADSVDMELEADQYAATHVGKEVMKSAIEKLIYRGADLIEKIASLCGNQFEKTEYLDQFFNNESIKTRLNALN